MKKVKTNYDEGEESETHFCNMCGLSCKSPAGINYGLIDVEVTGGYESTHIQDGDVHEFSLCERCLSEMFAKFKYPSLKGNFLEPYDEENNPDFDPQDYRGQTLEEFIINNPEAAKDILSDLGFKTTNGLLSELTPEQVEEIRNISIDDVYHEDDDLDLESESEYTRSYESDDINEIRLFNSQTNKKNDLN